MIKDNQKYFNRLHVVIDGVVVAVSYVLAWFIQFEFIVDETTGKLPVGTYMSALIFVIPGLLLLYYAFNLYTPKRVQGRRLEGSNIVKANAIACLCFFFVLFLAHLGDFSRKMAFMFFGLNVVMEVLVRNLIRIVLMNMRRKGMNLKHILCLLYTSRCV